MKKRKSQKFRALLFFALIAIMLSGFLVGNFYYNALFGTGIALGLNKKNIALTTDGNDYLITVDGAFYTRIPKIELSNQVQQQSFLQQLDVEFPDGYIFLLGDELMTLTSDSATLVFGDTAQVSANLKSQFNGYESSNESFSWKFRKKGQTEWNIDTREKTNHYNFGKTGSDNLDVGDYQIQGEVNYSFNFGGRNFTQILFSNIIDLKIETTDGYTLRIPNERLVFGTVLNTINFRGGLFYNELGYWDLSVDENGSRQIQKGDNWVKCTFTPHNSGFASKSLNLNIIGVLKEIKVLVSNTHTVFGKPLDNLSFKFNENENSLFDGDTIDDVGIKLKLVNSNDNSPVTRIKAGIIYRVLGDVANTNYAVNFANEDDPNSYWKNKGGQHTILFDKLQTPLDGVGDATVSREQGFDLNISLNQDLENGELPFELDGENYYLIKNYKTVFKKNGSELAITGNLNFEFKNLNQNIKFLAYFDGDKWTKINVENGRVIFSAEGVQRIVFIGQQTEDWNVATIILGILLALSVGTLIFLSAIYFGRKKNA